MTNWQQFTTQSRHQADQLDASFEEMFREALQDDKLDSFLSRARELVTEQARFIELPDGDEVDDETVLTFLQCLGLFRCLQLADRVMG